MAYFEENSPELVQLESMVDAVGVRNVLWALARICELKAEHVESTWQDRTLSREWRTASRKLDRQIHSHRFSRFSGDKRLAMRPGFVNNRGE